MPLAGRVKLKPLNDMLWFATRADTPAGTGPEPVFTVSVASVEKEFTSMRLVIDTGRNTVRLAVTVAPGLPVHTKTMSPTRSVKPSACTVGGTAETTQVVGVWG